LPSARRKRKFPMTAKRNRSTDMTPWKALSVIRISVPRAGW
jgi:hypothetical protein